MKKVFALFIMLMAVSVCYAQRTYIMSGTYKASDTVDVTQNYNTTFSHIGYDSIKFWVSATDSISVFIDKVPVEPTTIAAKYAYGSWAVVDSLSGTTNNGTGYGTGNLVVSTVWKGLDVWNYRYRLRFRSTLNGATGGSYRFGWYLKKN